jgi:hypothetical protein
MNIWDEVITHFNTEIETLKQSLAEGNAPDYASYRQTVGMCAGIEWARNSFTDIIKKRTYTDDEEE